MQVRPEDDHERPRSPGVATRRLEAFSDAVFAIAITLLALNLQVPVGSCPRAPASVSEGLGEQWPTYLSFVLSFVTLLIAWVSTIIACSKGRNARAPGSSLPMGCSCSPFRQFPSRRRCWERI